MRKDNGCDVLERHFQPSPIRLSITRHGSKSGFKSTPFINFQTTSCNMYPRGTKRKARKQIVSPSVTKKPKAEAHKGFPHLPESIVRRIFACLYSGCEWDPLMLSHVCQQWRNVALSTPELWSTIRLEGALDLVRARHYIELSDKMLLSIELLGPEKLHDEMSDHRMPFNILCLLFDNRDRWRHISVGSRLPGMMTLHTLTSICAFLPQLRSISVRGELLNDIRVIPHSIKNTFTDVLWQSVETLSFSGCTFDSVAAAWGQFTNVSHLKLGNISFPDEVEDEYETPDTVIKDKLLKVKSLVVYPSGVSLRRLFCRISAAALEHLTLEEDNDYEHDTPTTDSGPGQPLWFPTSPDLEFKLQSLTIKNAAQVHTLEVFHRLPALKRLIIHEHDPHSTIITPMFMTYLRHLHAKVRPKLDYLELVWDMACHAHDAQIVPWDFYLTAGRVRGRGREEAEMELCKIYEGMVLNMVKDQVAEMTEAVLGSRRIYGVEGGGLDTVHPRTRERIRKLQDEGWRISVR